jgi:hypothetical protein
VLGRTPGLATGSAKRKAANMRAKEAAENGGGESGNWIKGRGKDCGKGERTKEPDEVAPENLKVGLSTGDKEDQARAIRKIR